MEKSLSLDQFYMKRALEIAKRGIGSVNPNPLVGAVIVKEGEIIAEGYHQYYGGLHAEANALKYAKEKAEGATMYVNLEPCSHFGKTPPCAEEIVKHKLKRVVVGMIDPNIKVSGKGINILREAGIEVTTGVMEEACKKINEVFIKYITKKEPFVVMKTAMTLDGKIASKTMDSKWVSCEKSREFVHELRNSLSGIMVGINTILKDNPLLTTRLYKGQGRNPVAIILDSKLRIDMNSKILNTIDSRKVIIAATKDCNKEKKEKLEAIGAKVLIVESNKGKVSLKDLMKKLGAENIDSILLEGGGEVNFSALEEGIVDKVISFIAPKILGGREAKTPVEGEGIVFMKEAVNLENIKVTQMDKDIMVEGYIERR